MKRWAYIHVGDQRSYPDVNDNSPQICETRDLLVLAESLLRFTPHIALPPLKADTGNGLWLEISGSSHLFGGETSLIEQILDFVTSVGFHPAGAIANRPETARLLARFRQGPAYIVPPNRDRDVLSQLPIGILNPSSGASRFLHQLGITHLGELARLNLTDIEQRLGHEGKRMVSIARALPQTPPALYKASDSPIEDFVFDPPMVPDEALLFTLKRLIYDLILRVTGRSRAIVSLDLELHFDSQPTRHEPFLFAHPLSNEKALFEAVRLRLSEGGSRPWESPDPPRISYLSIQASELVDAPQIQNNLFHRQQQHQEVALINRLGVVLGSGNVLSASIQNSHLPDTSWVGGSYPPQESENPPERQIQRPVFLLPTPLPLQGSLARGEHLKWPNGNGVIHDYWGPERLRGQWWSKPYARDYFVAELQRGERIWLYRDLHTHTLHIHGIFD